MTTSICMSTGSRTTLRLLPRLRPLAALGVGLLAYGLFYLMVLAVVVGVPLAFVVILARALVG